jgi:hypothetical protein
MSVSDRFSQFLDNLCLTDAQAADGATKRESVVKALNQHYWNSSSGTSNSRFVGSWAKHTRTRPPRDVDVLFELPQSVRTRFDGRTGNKQSQLLQEVKSILSSSFSRTAIKGDGPVVIIPFASYSIELIPAFARYIGGHDVCMTSLGGWYKREDYGSQVTLISSSDTSSNGNTRHLIRMMKCWQGHCSVPLKSFHIELMAVEFIKTWGNRGKSKVYYDWMVRDFLAHLLSQQNATLYAPGTGEALYPGALWASRADTALTRARKACNYEADKQWGLAGDEWQKIFGTYIPRNP